MLVDSHAHISYFPKEQQEDIINQAFASGVKIINNISTEVLKFPDIIASCYNNPNIYCTVGTHPCHVQDEPHITHKEIIEIAKTHSQVIGIGETGLDYHHSIEYKNLQIDKLHEHIIASVELQIPIIIHTRNANDDTLSILSLAKKKYADRLQILIHCFTGELSFCQKLLEIGCYISYSGIITFKNAKEIQSSMHNTPMERILIETDSPFLAPEPHRGKENQPKFVKHVAEYIAKERNIAFEEVCNITGNNFKKLFKIK